MRGKPAQAGPGNAEQPAGDDVARLASGAVEGAVQAPRVAEVLVAVEDLGAQPPERTEPGPFPLVGGVVEDDDLELALQSGLPARISIAGLATARTRRVAYSLR